MFQLSPVGQSYRGPGVADDAGLVECLETLADAGTANSEQLSQNSVRDRQLAGIHCVRRNEKPAGEPLLDGMKGVASSYLGGLKQNEVDVAKDYTAKNNELFESSCEG